MFKVGDRIKQRYISDYDRHNNMPATILRIWNTNYYPNGDYSVVVERPQAEIKYDNGDIACVLLDIKGCGILSPFEKCE